MQMMEEIEEPIDVPTVERVFKNNQDGLKAKLKEFKLKLNWIEKMNLISIPAPMAPEMMGELKEGEEKNIVRLKTHHKNKKILRKDNSIVLDDFKRELSFHRQAQSAVIEGFKKLDDLGIPTLRPDDYFAEMAKSDEHMHKIRKSLAAKQAGAIRAERVGQLRRLKKLGKQTQLETRLQQQSEKKKMLEEVKKYRKGLRKDLDFLDNKPGKGKGKEKAKGKGREKSGSGKKRQLKNEKYGFGGKKRNVKQNTKQSSSSLKSSIPKKSGKPKKRFGRSRRKQMKK